MTKEEIRAYNEANMANAMKETAESFGLKLEEEFLLKGSLHKYKFTEDGLMCFLNWGTEWIPADLNELVAGKYTIIKHKPILTDIEKEYLLNIIKPFRDSVVTIAKCNCYGDCAYFIQIMVIQNNRPEYINLPYFEKGRMYRGMKTNKEYTLEKLDL